MPTATDIGCPTAIAMRQKTDMLHLFLFANGTSCVQSWNLELLKALQAQLSVSFLCGFNVFVGNREWNHNQIKSNCNWNCSLFPLVFKAIYGIRIHTNNNHQNRWPHLYRPQYWHASEMQSDGYKDIMGGVDCTSDMYIYSVVCWFRCAPRPP